MPAHIERADLVSAGQFGLIDAIDRFDLDRGLQFETYAVQRIKGEMLDELRSQDWVPRSVRSAQNEVKKAVEAVSQGTGVPVSIDEVVERSSLTKDEVTKAVSSVEYSTILSMDKRVSPRAGTYADKGATASLGDMVTNDVGDLGEMFENVDPDAVVEAMDGLDNREIMVVTMHYYLGRSLAEIGREFGVTESRVCQIHTKALKTIRNSLK